MKLEFYGPIFEKSSNIKSNENSSIWSRIVLCRRTDILVHDNANSRFSQLCEPVYTFLDALAKLRKAHLECYCEIWSSRSFTPLLDEDEWLASRSGWFSPMEIAPLPLDDLQNWSRQGGEDINSCLFQKSNLSPRPSTHCSHRDTTVAMCTCPVTSKWTFTLKCAAQTTTDTPLICWIPRSVPRDSNCDSPNWIQFVLLLARVVKAEWTTRNILWREWPASNFCQRQS